MFRLAIRSGMQATATASGGADESSLRVTRGRKVERILLDAKWHVITQFRYAQEAARVARMNQRVGQVSPALEKAAAGDGR